MQPPYKPLQSLHVLDLTTFLSGPFATQILGDLGADVVKIENPDGGDPTRHLPPHFIDEDSVYYLSINRNKRSIVLDLKSAAGKASLLKLIKTADVVIDNYRPGVLEKLGLSPQQIVEQHPRLIWASISGYGQFSKRRTQPAYDMIVQALAGVMSITGEPGGNAVRLGIPAGDTVAGLYATIGILAALSHVRAQGNGVWIDISMLDCQLAMLAYQGAYTLFTHQPTGRQGARHDSIPTYRSFKGSDGKELVVTANTERMWEGLCRALGAEDLLSDRRYRDPAARLSNKESLWMRLEELFATKPCDDWLPLLTRQGVPCAAIRDTLTALEEARADGNLISSMQSQDGQVFESVRTPIHFADHEVSRDRFPPALGANQKDPDLARP